MLGVTSFWVGEFWESRRYLEEAIARYSPEHHERHIALYSQDPKVVCLCRLGWTLWYLGYPDQAAEARGSVLSLAEELGHPFSRCYASLYGAIVSQELDDEVAAGRAGRGDRDPRDERAGFHLLPTWASLLRQWSLARGGDRGAIDAMGAAINPRSRKPGRRS